MNYNNCVECFKTLEHSYYIIVRWNERRRPVHLACLDKWTKRVTT